MKKVLALIVVLGIGSMAFGVVPADKTMPRADVAPVIDGDLSEWQTNGCWYPMDVVAYGAPEDMSNVYMAARWDENNVYMAVTLYDSDLQLGQDDIAWNGQDDIEVYIDPQNLDTVGYNLPAGDIPPSTRHEDIQQWFIGPRGDNPGGVSPVWTGETWYDLGSFPLPIDGNGITCATVVAANGQITYEAQIPTYSKRSEGLLHTLEYGCVIGFDIVAAGKGSTGSYCWMGLHDTGGKYTNAAAMQNWILIPEPCTMILLGLGSVALIRRKK